MTTDAVGGIWTYTVDLGRELVRKGLMLKLAVLGPPPDEAKAAAARIAGLTVIETGLAPEWLARDAGEVSGAGEALAELARREAVDIVHLNHPALAAETRFDAPVLAACHSCVATWWEAVKGTTLPDNLRWRTDMVGRGYLHAQALVAPSRAFAEATRRVYGLAEDPEVVHNGRSPNDVEPAAGDPVEAIFTAGRLWDEGKNARTLDRIGALSTAPFWAAGPSQGPDGSAVDLRYLDVLGPLPEAEVRQRLAQRPIYVSAALYEPFGLAILEAAQAGCALVLSDIDSLRELWSDAALFAPPNDEEAFAAAIGRLLSDPELRAEYAYAARNRARTFGLDAFVDDMSSLYDRLLAGQTVRTEAA